VGITFLSDIIDGHNFIDFRLGYAQKFRIRNGKLSVGLQLGLLNKTPRSELNPAESGDPLLLHKTEPFLDFDMNFGLFYKTPTWYVGVSSTKLLESVRVSGSEFSSLHNARQFYISGGYIWNLKTAVPWTIEPSVLIHSEIASWRLHLMALARYNGILWFGLSYQHNNAIAVLLGATPFYNSTNEYLKGLEMGIAYGFDTKKTGWQKGGTWGDFEIVVRYGFNFYKEKSLTGYGSSRHLYKNQY
jgi:type IX secretion system PorP/SprF family membrane protein